MNNASWIVRRPHSQGRAVVFDLVRRKGPFISALLLALLLGHMQAAAELPGVVVNATTKRAAAGDEVVLLTLSQNGMNEVARTKADDLGRFRLPLNQEQSSQLVRVIHQGVTYHQPIQSNEKPVTVRVYDVADKLDRITAVMDVQRFEAEGDSLMVRQLITMRNASQPPRTLMNDRPFEIELPPGAQVEAGLVQVADAQPLKQKPMAGERVGQYYFVFPLRPGDTRFAVIYRLPYSGTILIQPKIRNSGERFVVMVPKSMKFTPQVAETFQAWPNTTPDDVRGTGQVSVGENVAFQIAGTGRLGELEARRQEEAEVAEKSRPGGGLGRPIDAPDPLSDHRWSILAGFAVVMLAGAVYVVRKPSRLQAPQHQSAGHRMPMSSPGYPRGIRGNRGRRRRVRRSREPVA